MADRAFQVSGKLPDGRIFVVGADDYITFANNLTDALGDEAMLTLADFKTALVNASSITAARPVPAAPAAPQWGQPAPAMTPVEVAQTFNATVMSDNAGVVCKHGEPAKFVPAGVSKKTGKPYRAFYACARRDNECDFRANG